MGFESPAMLLGALAALVPIIIHLVNRARAKPVRFAALEFLFVSDKRLARRLRLRQLLVLLLRVLLLAAIPFAFAKPYCSNESPMATVASEPGAVVLVIDNSASMGALVAGEQSALEKAKEKAAALIGSGGSSTSFGIVTASVPPRVLGGTLSYDHNALLRLIDGIGVQPRRSAIGQALREAERLLAASGETRRRVVVLTDNAKHLWEEVNQPWALRDIPDADVIDVREGAELDNLAVTDAKVRPASTGGAGRFEVVVTVRNFGLGPAKAALKLEAFGEAQSVDLSIPAASETTHVFAQPATKKGDSVSDSGLATATVTTDGGDALPSDDRWFFTTATQGAASVAIVNGAPRTTAWADELFFVRAALAADVAGGSPRLRATILSPDDITTTALEAYDSVLMANVGALNTAQRLALEAYVKAGGGLFVTSGERLTAEAAVSYGALLPLAVRGLKAVVRPDDPAAALKALVVTQVDGEHPALEEFAGLDDASLFRTKVYTYALLDNSRADVRVLMALTGGIPALVEGALGRGKTMMLTTSIDRDWTDLPIRSSFVPLLQQVLLYLSGRLDATGKRIGLIDDLVPVVQPTGEGDVTLTRPDGETRDLGAEPTDEYTIANTNVVGHYLLTRKIGKLPVSFAINQDRAESDLSPQDTAVLRTLLDTPGTVSGAAVVGDSATVAPPANRTKLWPTILVLLFVLLATEAWLVLRG